MRKINPKLEDLENLKFNGIIVGVDLIGNLHFIFECAYYSEGKHGYALKGHHPDSSNLFSVSYDTRYLQKGLFFNSTSRLTVDLKFNNDDFNYYIFEDMQEFCNWYLTNYTERHGSTMLEDSVTLPVEEKKEEKDFVDINLGSKLDKMVSVMLEDMSAMDLWRAVFNKMTKPAKRQLMNELLNNCLGNGYNTKPYIFGKED